MGELAAYATGLGDVAGPGEHHAVAGPTEMGCNLLEPLERRAHRPGPAYRNGAKDLWPAQFIIARKYLREWLRPDLINFLRVSRTFQPTLLAPELGSASRRERVGQYVKSSVGAVSMKKKKV